MYLHVSIYPLTHSPFNSSIANKSANGKMLEVSLSYSQVICPWTGWLSVTLSVVNEGSGFNGEATGQISLTISTSTVSY